jgi:hypothetical protein
MILCFYRNRKLQTHLVQVNCSLPVCVAWFDLWEQPFSDDGSPFMPVSCAMLTGDGIFELAGIVSTSPFKISRLTIGISFNWVEEAIDIQPQTKLAANHLERLALKLDVTLKSVFPTSSTQIFLKTISCEVLWNHHLNKNYKPPALPNWVQILFFEYVCWGYRYLELIC